MNRFHVSIGHLSREAQREAATLLANLLRCSAPTTEYTWGFISIEGGRISFSDSGTNIISLEEATTLLSTPKESVISLSAEANRILVQMPLEDLRVLLTKEQLIKLIEEGYMI